MIKTVLRVVYDEQTSKHYIDRPDCPNDNLKEITLGAVIDLWKNLIRYQSDAWKEKYKL